MNAPNIGASTDGVVATRAIVEENLGYGVVVLTSFSDQNRIVGALDAGAVGYLLKNAEPGDLLAGVHAAARGESPNHPRAARQLLSARADRTAAARLRPRELKCSDSSGKPWPTSR